MLTLPHKATIDDLIQVPNHAKAELVNGEIVSMPPTGGDPGRTAGDIYSSLRQYERQSGTGFAYPDNVGFRVNLPNRASFSPDAAFHTGPRTGMKFLEGAPVFAVEVRSENDYGPEAELQMAEKRRDYFAAGTVVVWDVDLLSESIVKVYRSTDPDAPTIYRRGEIAEAEPAVPGWTIPVDDLFT
ncbi:MAG: Uma2 family endonuclease [Acidobacteria bacterium]|nr:Uma2 family endonuclease [Acidobacteriota bacterium]